MPSAHSPAIRIFQLETGHNFRDIGGYPTEDGRHVRWRRIFRSGVMSRIAGEDAQKLRALGVATICDFRTNEERTRRPVRWHLDTPVELIERDHEMSAGALEELVRRAEIRPDQVRDVMLDVYRELPYEQVESYRRMFARIAEGRLPLIFNCSAGKDRTGVAAALLLTLLGVPRPIIVEDYVLTNDMVESLIPIVSGDPVYGSLIRDRRDAAMPLLRAEPEYLQAMFGRIEASHGSVGAYMEDVLGVTPEVCDAIRAELLE